MTDEPVYLHSCAGCSAHLVSTVKPPRVDGFGQGRYCARCTEKNAALAESWGRFQKGDRVKLRSGLPVWYPTEELTVSSIDEEDNVTVFRLGFGLKYTAVIPAGQLEFKYTYGRN